MNRKVFLPHLPHNKKSRSSSSNVALLKNYDTITSLLRFCSSSWIMLLFTMKHLPLKFKRNTESSSSPSFGSEKTPGEEEEEENNVTSYKTTETNSRFGGEDTRLKQNILKSNLSLSSWSEGMGSVVASSTTRERERDANNYKRQKSTTTLSLFGFRILLVPAKVFVSN